MTDLEREERRAMWESLTPAQRIAKQRERDIEASYHPDFNAAIVERAQKRMDRVDAFPVDVRAVIYENGLEIVQEFWNHGVRKAKSIQHLIDTVRGTDLPNGQARFKINKGPNTARNPAEWKSGDMVGLHLVVVSVEPTKKMIDASLAEVSGFTERMTKSEKHRRRLRAALHAAIKSSNDK